MKVKNIDNYEFIEESLKDIEVVFSCAKGNLNFNKNSSSGLENLDNLKAWFNVEKVIYLNQIHSDEIKVYNKFSHDNFIKMDGDALITKEVNVALGVFTADCVPVFVYDKKNKVVASIHSGWKGTYSLIVFKTIKKMISDYNSNVKDLMVYIGPHIGLCCYEVDRDLSNKFTENKVFGDEVVEGNNLNLTLCIKKQCIKLGVDLENIITEDKCTYCCNEEYFSYRRDKTSNRMFSFIVIRN
ncbi:peptidoglycan editing factor PgeF [Haloimpatiens sp. FM7315]|uniref:peptidoglycan editing factor PgeF n=1 Tax=Haloimpatiens sp. FM7315 TaxID=3298609 RepID=UPI0035A2B3B3